MDISKETARDARIYDGEEFVCYDCGEAEKPTNPKAENPYLHYIICDDCNKKEVTKPPHPKNDKNTQNMRTC